MGIETCDNLQNYARNMKIMPEIFSSIFLLNNPLRFPREIIDFCVVFFPAGQVKESDKRAASASFRDSRGDVDLLFQLHTPWDWSTLDTTDLCTQVCLSQEKQL